MPEKLLESTYTHLHVPRKPGNRWRGQDPLQQAVKWLPPLPKTVLLQLPMLLVVVMRLLLRVAHVQLVAVGCAIDGNAVWASSVSGRCHPHRLYISLVLPVADLQDVHVGALEGAWGQLPVPTRDVRPLACRALGLAK